ERELRELHAQVRELQAKIGQQTMELDFFSGCLSKSRSQDSGQRQRWKEQGRAEVRSRSESQGGLTVVRMCRFGALSRAVFTGTGKPGSGTGKNRVAGGDPAGVCSTAAEWISSDYAGATAARLDHKRQTGSPLDAGRQSAGLGKRKFVVTTDSEHDFLIYPN